MKYDLIVTRACEKCGMPHVSHWWLSEANVDILCDTGNWPGHGPSLGRKVRWGYCDELAESDTIQGKVTRFWWIWCDSTEKLLKILWGELDMKEQQDKCDEAFMRSISS